MEAKTKTKTTNGIYFARQLFKKIIPCDHSVCDVCYNRDVPVYNSADGLHCANIKWNDLVAQ